MSIFIFYLRKSRWKLPAIPLSLISQGLILFISFLACDKIGIWIWLSSRETELHHKLAIGILRDCGLLQSTYLFANLAGMKFCITAIIIWRNSLLSNLLINSYEQSKAGERVESDCVVFQWELAYISCVTEFWTASDDQSVVICSSSTSWNGVCVLVNKK